MRIMYKTRSCVWNVFFKDLWNDYIFTTVMVRCLLNHIGSVYLHERQTGMISLLEPAFKHFEVNTCI